MGSPVKSEETEVSRTRTVYYCSLRTPVRINPTVTTKTLGFTLLNYNKP
jgi:hypothetical protein